MASAQEIGVSAFKGCSSLKNVTLSDSLTTISPHAFYGCTSLTDITIGTGVTKIGAYAFGGGSSLKTRLTTDNEVAKNYNWEKSGRYFYDLKVYDKYGDNEPELREWVKISDYNGQLYEYEACNKESYELTSEQTFTGTATDDTEIIFTYKQEKQDNQEDQEENNVPTVKYTLTVKDVFYNANGNIVKFAIRSTTEYDNGTTVIVDALTEDEIAEVAGKSGYILASDAENEVTVDSDKTVTFKYMMEKKQQSTTTVTVSETDISNATVTYSDAIEVKTNNAP
jgi:hypothetical protein